jgi:hypothetical protein
MKHQTESTSHSKKQDKAEENAASKQTSPASVQPVEPDDTQLAGHSKSQQRQALHQNVQSKQAHANPEYVAGQHATGSFTGKQGEKEKK